MAPVIRGMAIVYNRLSEVLGFFREQIAPEAMRRTLAEGVDLRALVDHDSSKLLGRLKAGSLRVETDAHGLRVEIVEETDDEEHCQRPSNSTQVSPH